jgi:hypothetical protein
MEGIARNGEVEGTSTKVEKRKKGLKISGKKLNWRGARARNWGELKQCIADIFWIVPTK